MTAVEFIIEQLAKNGVLHSSDIAKAKEMGDRGKENFRELFMAKRTGDGFMKMYHTSGC